MSARLEVVLFIGETRYEAYDEIELVMKSGRVLKGRIIPMNNTRYFYLDTKERVEVIYPADIERDVP